MEKEFIIETQSGSLYHVHYKKALFHHGSSFTLRQLVGRTMDFAKDDKAAVRFGTVDDTNVTIAPKDLLLSELKVGTCIISTEDPNVRFSNMQLPEFKVWYGKNLRSMNKTSLIVKIFERVQ